MNAITNSSRFASRVAKAAGILSIAVIAGLATSGNADAKGGKGGFHGHHRHGHHFVFDYGYRPYYDYGYDRRCFFRGRDGRIHKRWRCRGYGYGHWNDPYWR